MRKLKSYVLPTLLAGLLFVWTVDQALADSPAQDPRCKGLKGTALGLCLAAIAVGCDADMTTPGCESIEDNFIQIIGDTPPWLPECPCGSSELFRDIVDKAFDDSEYNKLYCEDEVNHLLSISTFEQPHVVFSFYPGQEEPPNYPKQTCGFYNTSEYDLNDEEAQSCINELQETIEYYSNNGLCQ